MFNKIVRFKLKCIAKLILVKHKPKVIGITGSLGKTTAKNAIFEVLKNDFDVFVSEKSMNTEFGIPYTVLRTEGPKNLKNVLDWIKIFYHGFRQLSATDYPKVLVLEYGVDYPKDMDYLLSIVKPDISVFTGISDVHLEAFGSVENIMAEKEKIVSKVPGTKIILNTDFLKLKDLAKKTSNEKLTYGLSCFLSDAESCITATDVQTTSKGLNFKIRYKNKKYPIKTKLFGDHSVYSVLSAFSVGIMMGMKPKDIVSKLKDIRPTCGRMNLLQGINGSTIIDDSYNSSPKAAISAIKSVMKFKPENRIILVLGSMNELGEEAEEAHRKVGVKAGEVADILVTIGENAEKWLAWSAKGRGLTRVYSFDDPFSAGEYLKDKIQKNDLVLVKGSQNKVYTEEVTKILMDEKYKPEDVLVRQDSFWKNKKAEFKNSLNAK